MEERLEETRALPLSETPLSETPPSESPTADLPVVSPTIPPAAPAAPPTRPLWGQVLRVAWLSIGLGLLLELTLLLLRAYTGTAGDSPKPFVADLAQKVSWGFIVCVGLAFGSTAAKARESVMGFLGLISAPAGFAVARMAHKGVSQALSLSGSAAAGASPFLIGGLKGIEYGLLGAAIGWVGKKAWGGLGAHTAVGALIGLLFGGAILAVTQAYAPAPLPLIDWLSRGVNEFLFPVGCSLVLYAAGALAKR